MMDGRNVEPRLGTSRSGVVGLCIDGNIPVVGKDRQIVESNLREASKIVWCDTRE
jgi:hypothetical protein